MCIWFIVLEQAFQAFLQNKFHVLSLEGSSIECDFKSYILQGQTQLEVEILFYLEVLIQVDLKTEVMK